MSDAKRQHVDPAPVARDWSKPRAVDDLMLAFAAHPVEDFLPDWNTLPEQFRREWHSSENAWTKAISDWFHSGLSRDTVIEAKPGIDAKTAVRHVSATLKSWAPKHEHKIAGCAYLLSLWFHRFGDAGKSA